MSDCPFCGRIERGEYGSWTDRPAVVWFEPLNPVTPGHLLFVPVSHTVSNSAQAPYATGIASEHAARWARDRGVESYNILTSHGTAATQTVPHVHIHLVPRREGDGLALPWTGQKERQQIDPGKLDLLADWFDHDDAVHGRDSSPEVQADLRRWAKMLRGVS